MADSEYNSDEQVETVGSEEDSEKAKAEAKADEDILQTMRDRVVSAESAEKDNRTLALDDLKHISGDQWPEEIKQKRLSKSRPVLTINKLPGQIRQVTNDQRQNRPSFKTSPVDDRGDIHTSKVLNGLLRHILVDSNADAAFDTAFEGACQAGFGYWRVYRDYVNPMSFDQKIMIGRIPNQFNVFLDPFHQEPDGSDAKWGIIFDDVSKKDFEAEYPNSKLCEKGADWSIYGSQYPDWITDESCKVAEYFYIEYEQKTIVLLSDGRVVEEKDLAKAMGPEGLAAGLRELNRRKANLPKVKHCKTNGIEIFEKTDWPGKWIPIIPAYGNELIVEGKKIRESLIRHAKDAQAMYNFHLTAGTEMIALAPKVPYIGAAGQFEGFEDQWENANSETYAYLEYNQVDADGKPAAPPQRNVYEPPVQAITQYTMIAADDIKNTTGIHDAAMGRASNETSGVAIQRRANQAQTSNFHFIDNLTRSMKHTGRILVDLIPKVYDSERAIRIIGEEDQEEILWIHKTFEKPDKNGKTIYDWAGDYDVHIEIGPAFATKRQEAAAQLIELSKAYPQLIQIAGDLIFKYLDVAGAHELSERIKKSIDPKFIEDPSGDNKQIPPQVAMQMQQLQQMVEQLTATTNEQSDTINNKRMELESKERIEMAKIQADIEINLAKLSSQEAIELLLQEVKQIEGRLQTLNFNAPVGAVDQTQPAPLSPEQVLTEQGGPDQVALDNQQPTGGITPGNSME